MTSMISLLNRICGEEGAQNSTELQSSEDPYKVTCVEYLVLAVQHQIANLSPIQSYVFSALYGAISIVGVIGNSLLIGIILWKPALRRSQNVLVVNLAFSNFLLSVILYPLLWQADRTRVFPYSSIVCKLATAIPGINIYCSTLTITALAVYRYYAVQATSRIAQKPTKLLMVCVIGIIWTGAVLLSTPLLAFYDIVQYPQNWSSIPVSPEGEIVDYSWNLCQLAPHHDLTTYQIISALISIPQLIFLYVIPIFVVFVFNYKLNKYVVNRRFRVKHRSPTITIDLNNYLPGSEQTLSVTTRSRTTRKLRTVLITMALSYALLWLPFSALTLLFDLGLITSEFLHKFNWLDHGFKCLSMVSVCLNPIIYGYMNSNFNRALREIIIVSINPIKNSACSAVSLAQTSTAAGIALLTRLTTSTGVAHPSTDDDPSIIRHHRRPRSLKASGTSEAAQHLELDEPSLIFPRIHRGYGSPSLGCQSQSSSFLGGSISSPET